MQAQLATPKRLAAEGVEPENLAASQEGIAGVQRDHVVEGRGRRRSGLRCRRGIPRDRERQRKKDGADVTSKRGEIETRMVVSSIRTQAFGNGFR